jgi:hypothetical protein
MPIGEIKSFKSIKRCRTNRYNARTQNGEISHSKACKLHIAKAREGDPKLSKACRVVIRKLPDRYLAAIASGFDQSETIPAQNENYRDTVPEASMYCRVRCVILRENQIYILVCNCHVCHRSFAQKAWDRIWKIICVEQDLQINLPWPPHDRNFPCQTLKISKVSLVVMGS